MSRKSENILVAIMALNASIGSFCAMFEVWNAAASLAFATVFTGILFLKD
jgi:hypothetical protein